MAGGWQTGKIRVELDVAGVRELLLSDEVGDELARRGRDVAAAADQRYAEIEVGARDAGQPGRQHITTEVHRGEGKNRSRVRVVADHPAAQRVEAAHRVLGQSMDAARG
jgi:hypothetical protein